MEGFDKIAEKVSEGYERAIDKLDDYLIPTFEKPEQRAPFLSRFDFLAKTEYAGLLSGMEDASQKLEEFLTTGGHLEKWDTTRSGIENFAEDFIAKTGLDETVELGLRETVSFLERTKLPEWTVDTVKATVPESMRAEIADVWYESWLTVESGLNEAADAIETVWENPYKILVPIDKLAECEQNLLKWGESKGYLLWGKKIDYLVGSQYVPGMVADVPLIGNISNICSKAQLDVDISKEDWVRAGRDTAIIVSVVGTPWLLPYGTLAAGAGGFTTQCALRFATIGGATSAIYNAGTVLAQTGDAAEMLKAAGKGALQGAVLGAVGGAASGRVLYHMGASLKASVLAGAAGGSSVTSLAEGAQTLYETGDYLESLKAACGGFIKGGAIGGTFGGAAHGAGRLIGKIRPLPEWPKALPEPPGGLMIRVDPARAKYGVVPVRPGFEQHHIIPRSLGGMDSANNIAYIPVHTHKRTPHPPLEVKKAPSGTIFF